MTHQGYTSNLFALIDPPMHLKRGVYQCNRSERLNIHPEARTEMLARLLALHHQRYTEEVAAGLHDNRQSQAKSEGIKNKTASLSPASPSVSSSESNGLFEDE
jgi:hypothetical protein